MRKPEKMIIYNLFPLLAGKAGQWESHLKRASDMGFNWVFVNPIQSPGGSGSLYSIKDYFQINPLFVDEASSVSPIDQIKEANKQAEKLSPKLLLKKRKTHSNIVVRRENVNRTSFREIFENAGNKREG